MRIQSHYGEYAFQRTQQAKPQKTASDIRFQSRIDLTLERSLLAFRDRLLEVVDKDTSNNAENYEQRKGICPLTGHCAGVASYIQSLYGGTTMRAELKVRINGEEKMEVHYWNKFGDKEYDVTGSQYGGDGIHPLNTPEGKPKGKVEANGVSVEFIEIVKLEPREEVKPSPWFEILNQRLDQHLGVREIRGKA